MDDYPRLKAYFYYITSDFWDLHALQAVLVSGIARLFVGTYATIMAGGFLRAEFQGASYLDRYNSLCRKLVQEQLYMAASVLASPRTATNSGNREEFSEFTGFRRFVSRLAAYRYPHLGRNDTSSLLHIPPTNSPQFPRNLEPGDIA